MKKKALWTTLPNWKSKPVIKLKKFLRPISKSRAAQSFKYRKLRKIFLKHQPWCQCCIPSGRAVSEGHFRSTQAHHSRGRSGKLYLDVRYWKAVCANCHRWITDNPEKARLINMLCDKGDWGKQAKTGGNSGRPRTKE